VTSLDHTIKKQQEDDGAIYQDQKDLVEKVDNFSDL
jgi:hypothetical protein